MGRAFEFRKARKMKRWSAMSKAFTRIGKDIVMAVKEGGPDPDSNSRLRAVIQNAKSVNMPKDNVERAIKRASDKSQGDYKEGVFEGYAPHGIAVLIETAPLETLKLFVSKDAIPLFDTVASSPEYVIVPLDSDTSKPSPAEKVIVPPNEVAVEFDPSVTVIDEFASSAFATPPSLIVTAPEDTAKLSE